MSHESGCMSLVISQPEAGSWRGGATWWFQFLLVQDIVSSEQALADLQKTKSFERFCGYLGIQQKVLSAAVRIGYDSVSHGRLEAFSPDGCHIMAACRMLKYPPIFNLLHSQVPYASRVWLQFFNSSNYSMEWPCFCMFLLRSLLQVATGKLEFGVPLLLSAYMSLGGGVHMFSFKYHEILIIFVWSTFHDWGPTLECQLGQLEELEHSGQVLSSAFSADGSFVGVNPGCFQGGWRMKIPWIFSAFFAWIQGCDPLCRSYGLGLAGFHWWIGLKPRNIYHEMLGNETLPLNGRWWIWKICKWFHWGSQIRRPFRSCAILSSLLTDFFESANWYACIDSGHLFSLILGLLALIVQLFALLSANRFLPFWMFLGLQLLQGITRLNVSWTFLWENFTEVITASFSPDSTRLVTGSEDGCGRVWDVLLASLWG